MSIGIPVVGFSMEKRRDDLERKKKSFMVFSIDESNSKLQGNGAPLFQTVEGTSHLTVMERTSEYFCGTRSLHLFGGQCQREWQHTPVAILVDWGAFCCQLHMLA